MSKEYPTDKYQEMKDCPGKDEITLTSIKPYKPDAKAGDKIEDIDNLHHLHLYIY